MGLALGCKERQATISGRLGNVEQLVDRVYRLGWAGPALPQQIAEQ